MSDRWVNANITLLIPLDSISINDTAYNKQSAVADILEIISDYLNRAPFEISMSGKWEDCNDI